MNLTIPILILIIIILLIGIIPLSDYSKERRIYYNILLRDLVNNVKTGDLVLFRSSIHVPINAILGSNQFSHSGMVIIINKKPYIYELVSNNLGKYSCHKDFKMDKVDVQLVPMYDRIKYYAGNCYIASLNSELTPTQHEKLVKFMENNKDHKFINYIKWFPFLLSKKSLKKESFCHEFIAKILHNLDISYTPIKSKKIHLSKTLINLCDGKTYSVPVHIIPNELFLRSPKLNLHKLPTLTYTNSLIHSDHLISQ